MSGLIDPLHFIYYSIYTIQEDFDLQSTPQSQLDQPPKQVPTSQGAELSTAAEGA